MTRIVIAAASVLLAAHQAAAQPYTLHPLASPTDATRCIAFDVNAAGVPAGYCEIDAVDRGVVWNAGVPAVLPSPAGFPFCRAYGINTAGDIVGTCHELADATSMSKAVLWTSGSAQVLATPEGVRSRAVDINEGGTVAGTIGRRPTVWTSEGVLTNAGDGDAEVTAINDDGQVALFLAAGGGQPTLGATWDTSTNTIEPLALPAGAVSAFPQGISSNGNVAAFVLFESGDVRAVRWISGSPEELSTPGGAVSWAFDINDAGTASGASSVRATIWRADEVLQLSESGSIAYAINNAGVAAGYIGSIAHLFVPKTAADGVQEIATAIQDLVSNETLQSKDANALQAQLSVVLARLADGDTTAAIKVLDAFIKKVEALVRSGALPSADGDALVEAATEVISWLQAS